MKRIKVRLRADRERDASELAREAEYGFNRDNLRPTFRAIKRLSSVLALDVNTLLNPLPTTISFYDFFVKIFCSSLSLSYEKLFYAKIRFFFSKIYVNIRA